MHISLIAAMTHQRVIGKNNQLPWHLPADLKHFKALTLNRPIIMGRKTYESIGKPLPQRTNLVLTSDSTYQADGCEVINTLEAAFKRVAEEEEVFVIGGASLYETFLPIAHRIYLTLVNVDVEGDTFFPCFDESSFNLVSREDHQADEKNVFGYSFLVWERRMASQG